MHLCPSLTRGSWVEGSSKIRVLPLPRSAPLAPIRVIVKGHSTKPGTRRSCKKEAELLKAGKALQQFISLTNKETKAQRELKSPTSKWQSQESKLGGGGHSPCAWLPHAPESPSWKASRRWSRPLNTRSPARTFQTPEMALTRPTASLLLLLLQSRL